MKPRDRPLSSSLALGGRLMAGIMLGFDHFGEWMGSSSWPGNDGITKGRLIAWLGACLPSCLAWCLPSALPSASLVGRSPLLPPSWLHGEHGAKLGEVDRGGHEGGLEVAKRVTSWTV